MQFLCLEAYTECLILQENTDWDQIVEKRSR